MTVTCDIVKKIFGGFKCCKYCHNELKAVTGHMLGDGVNYNVCCYALLLLKEFGVEVYEPITHKGLLKELNNKHEEEWL